MSKPTIAAYLYIVDRANTGMHILELSRGRPAPLPGTSLKADHASLAFRLIARLGIWRLVWLCGLSKVAPQVESINDRAGRTSPGRFARRAGPRAAPSVAMAPSC